MGKYIYKYLRINMLAVFIFLVATAFQCKKAEPDAASPVITQPDIRLNQLPLFVGRTNEPSVEVSFNLTADEKPLILEKAEISFDAGSRLTGLQSVTVGCSDTTGIKETPALFGAAAPVKLNAAVNGTRELGTGNHVVKFTFDISPRTDLLLAFRVQEVKLSFRNHEPLVFDSPGSFVFRPGLVLRAAGQDNCDTYRIPGLVTTGKGTLIAVYDNRYNNSKDLQEDVDIGMSRSTDGGQTWEPMKVIMDMGEYGGRSQRLNGIGDPCVLYDDKTHTLWVAALWMSGSSPDQMLWWASKPGMKPEETGQFILVKSADDGLTWSDPVNITSQIKDPSWQLLLQGPGRGITTKDGTLVFPAQFKADTGTKALDGGQYTCHSTVVTSRDGGKSWQIGTGAKSNTTEAQVVELADGRLMLNMRDDRNRRDKGETNGRAVATSTNLGKTWEVHPSSNSALPEPNCMASIISANVSIDGAKKQVLFFSNPNNKEARTNMTIKASLDGGLTWPEEYHTELNAAGGYGYSCMTMIDENTVGILYEGTKDLIFQKIHVNEILNR